MAKNPAAKTRKADSPYCTIGGNGWQWKVLKFWQADGKKPYARAFCLVHGFETEMGDVYVSELADVIRMGGTVQDHGVLESGQLALLLGLR